MKATVFARLIEDIVSNRDITDHVEILITNSVGEYVPLKLDDIKLVSEYGVANSKIYIGFAPKPHSEFDYSGEVEGIYKYYMEEKVWDISDTAADEIREMLEKEKGNDEFNGFAKNLLGRLDQWREEIMEFIE